MEEMEKQVREKCPDPETLENLGDDDWNDVPLFCVDWVTLTVIAGVVIAISVLVWKMIL